MRWRLYVALSVKS